MVPIYAARIEDLGPSDFVRVECIACSHGERVPADLVAPPTAVAALHPCARFGTATALPRVRCAREGSRVD
jgi:hypothetical protein